MFRGLALIYGFMVFGLPGFPQCGNLTTIVPDRPMKAANTARNFVRHVYELSHNDSLLIQSHEDTETTIGPYDLGFVIKRNGTTVRTATLRTLPEFRKQDADFSESFTTVAISRACRGEDSIYFVTMKYMGDELSPALVFAIIPSAHGYEITALPMFSGGTVEVSKANPLRVRIWHNLNEGMCNACATSYRITNYEIHEDGKFVETRRIRTRRLYSSGQFDDRRIRFVP